MSSEKPNGELITAAPSLFPSTLNCTLVMLGETLVMIGTVPETAAPWAGEVIEMAGAPELVTPIETAVLEVVSAAVSLAKAVSVWVPSDNLVVSSE